MYFKEGLLNKEFDNEQLNQELENEQLDIPDTLPLLPVRDVVIFPFMIAPLFVGRETSVGAVELALNEDRLIFLAAQKDITEDEPKVEDLYQFGTVCMVMRMLKLSDGRVKILVQGLSKGKIKSIVKEAPSYIVKIEKVHDPVVKELTLEMEAVMRNVREQMEKLSTLGKTIPTEVTMVIENIQDPGRLADLVAANLPLTVEEGQKILETINPSKRLKLVNDHLTKEIQVSSMQEKIQSQAKEEMDKSQREYFLREQMKAIKGELGDMDESTQEIDELREGIRKAKMAKECEKEANKQLERFEMMHPDTAEATIIRTYLDWLIELPWSKSTEDTLNIKAAKKILNEDHYALEKVKERILEYLAVRSLKKKLKSPVLCFVGPPGVGKTSLGKSIARAMGRKFIRISLGGMRDEAEIRGHRRTYVGAMPGRIIQGVKQAGSNNPVFMLDEIDKIGADFRGDPASALLEVLDPEQNNSFSDHYLNLPFDLSKFMFITTANLLDPIPSALKDRMEIINLPGYTEEEKFYIAVKYIIPRQLDENGITPDLLKISEKAVKIIISQYTREAGLRNLEREIATVFRKVARKVAEGRKTQTHITSRDMHEYLGPPIYLADDEQETDEIGVATGLAWTPVGGETLFVESTVVKGRGNLTLTGHLGNVMKESAQAALTYARSKTDVLGIAENFYEDKDIHIHVPAGAIPKDGPSAGVTMATSLISALMKTPVRKDVAMTGEITLRGRVLPIGGLKEKALAALRSNMSTLIIPENNRKDLEEIPLNVRKKITFYPVKHMDDVLNIALQKKTGRGAGKAVKSR
ncbi:MAG: endopeptidase La [Thermodesulfobacteriota bacterium]